MNSMYIIAKENMSFNSEFCWPLKDPTKVYTDAH